jgi:hypothetical protein
MQTKLHIAMVQKVSGNLLVAQVAFSKVALSQCKDCIGFNDYRNN